MFESVKLIDPTITMTGYLLGFAFTFLLYFVSGMFRRWEFRNKAASKIGLIIVHIAILMAIWVAYITLLSFYELPEAAIWIFLFLPLLVQISYRYQRGWKELQWRDNGLVSE